MPNTDLYQKRSSLTNLRFAKEDYSSLIDAEQDIDTVLLDLSKAFSVVIHRQNFVKLEVIALSPAIYR